MPIFFIGDDYQSPYDFGETTSKHSKNSDQDSEPMLQPKQLRKHKFKGKRKISNVKNLPLEESKNAVVFGQSKQFLLMLICTYDIPNTYDVHI